ncbi:MAG: NAD-dependent epimerase/dehydratase family protein [Candidatus Devosia phytovorans]|uniref:NAD-dependent epimerase/dehydratase family protein n=1 Tax=Candidatus Devosia phytovorans TaxID=3121372 RepID=A0AAJ5VRH3_9HYPH|nr:NAD-dependent epimerase/dehydratase family protein [Devosia sp.]WEK02800.1 MAG: NAD-dependent epimerase/dehydratase family protein [Devosia sp.]
MTQFTDAAPAAANAPAMPFAKIFLTGGSGYVGRNLIRQFTARGIAVVALVRSPASAALVTDLGATPVLGALPDADLVPVMAGCDALIHAAADTDHGHGSPSQFRINEEGTRAVFAAATAAGIATAVHLSTESVLADGRPLVRVTEDHPLPRRPAGAYSASKARAEQIALAANSADFRVVALRPRAVWGRDDTTAMPQLLAAAHSGQLAWISGGNYLTSTTHIANLCHGVELALAKGRGGEVYFLSDNDDLPFRHFVTGMLASQGLTAPDKTVPRPLLRLIAGLGDMLHRLSGGQIKGPLTLQAYATSAVEITLDISKAQRDLGYRPVITRAEGLAEMAAVR